MQGVGGRGEYTEHCPFGQNKAWSSFWFGQTAALKASDGPWRDSERRREANARTLAGTATAREVVAAASPRHVRRQAAHAHPSFIALGQGMSATG